MLASPGPLTEPANALTARQRQQHTSSEGGSFLRTHIVYVGAKPSTERYPTWRETTHPTMGEGAGGRREGAARQPDSQPDRTDCKNKPTQKARARRKCHVRGAREQASKRGAASTCLVGYDNTDDNNNNNNINHPSTTFPPSHPPSKSLSTASRRPRDSPPASR
ncbi:hypothetical protein CFE70_002428 [Pyrenophora teres f. teres 0-1]